VRIRRLALAPRYGRAYWPPASTDVACRADADVVGYRDTLIAVADDCPAGSGMVPPTRGAWPTIAMLHYELISARPYSRRQQDVLFETWLAQHNPVPAGHLAALREQCFDQPRACLSAEIP